MPMPFRPYLKPIVMAITVASVFFPVPGLAKEGNTTPTTDLETMVISAVRDDVEEKQVARPLALIPQDKLNQIQPSSTAQAVSYETNVQASGGPRAGNQTINIRGMEGQRVLQTVDGVRQNYQSGHRPTYFLDPVLLRSVEVLKGPASSLWGSAAIGGVVAQNTVNASDILKPDRNVGGLVKYGYNDNGEASATTMAVGARTDSLDLLASGYHRYSNDVELGHEHDNRDDTLANSGSHDDGLMFKGQWQITDAQSLALQLRRSDSDGSVPSNSAAGVSTSNFLIERNTENDNASLDYRIDTDSPLVDAQVMVYRNETLMDESRISDGRYDSTELKTRGYAINNKSDFGFASLLYGIDGYHDDFATERSGASRPTAMDATVDVKGAFVQATIPIIKDGLRAELGVRHDGFETEANTVNKTNSADAISPSAALVWQANDWLELALRYDEAFRAPSAEELYTTGTHFCFSATFCNRFVSNPNLDPEEAANKEFLARMQWDSVFATDDTLGFKASLFRNRVDNFIEQIVTDPVFGPPAKRNPGYTTWVNVNEAVLEGFELEARYAWENFNARLAYGQTRGQDRTEDDYLSNIPADKWVLDTHYVFVPSQKLLAGVRVTQASPQNHKPDANHNDYDGYTLADLYASWQPVGDSVTLDLSVNNVTNEYYRAAFQELYQPGREIKAAITYRF